MNKKAANVDEYIATFSPDVQEKLETIRRTIRNAAPNANEVISYAIPSYRQNGLLVHFAAFKNHIGFYPGAAAIEEFAPELEKYKTSKGAIQFPFNEPLPLKLISRITKHRVRQDLEKKKNKTTK